MLTIFLYYMYTVEVITVMCLLYNDKDLNNIIGKYKTDDNFYIFLDWLTAIFAAGVVIPYLIFVKLKRKFENYVRNISQ